MLGEKKSKLVTAKEGDQPAKAGKSETEERSDLESMVSELEGALKTEQAKSEDYLRRLQYLQADFENYRKRIEKEMGEAKRYGNERLLGDLLVVVDELELAFQETMESKENPMLAEGVGMVLKRLQGLLSKEGVVKIQSLGSRYDPDLHEAALRVASEKEDGTIVEEIRAGYLLKGRVLRPSIVKVAEKPAPVRAPEVKEGGTV